MNPINQQTAGPVEVGERDLYIHLFAPIPGRNRYAIADANIIDWGDSPIISRDQAIANARLIAAAYSAFDKAGRELGIDAAELAGKLDLAALIRAAYTVAMDANVVGGREPARVASADLNALCTPLLPFGEALSRAS